MIDHIKNISLARGAHGDGRVRALQGGRCSAAALLRVPHGRRAAPACGFQTHPTCARVGERDNIAAFRCRRGMFALRPAASRARALASAPVAARGRRLQRARTLLGDWPRRNWVAAQWKVCVVGPFVCLLGAPLAGACGCAGGDACAATLAAATLAAGRQSVTRSLLLSLRSALVVAWPAIAADLCWLLAGRRAGLQARRAGAPRALPGWLGGLRSHLVRGAGRGDGCGNYGGAAVSVYYSFSLYNTNGLHPSAGDGGCAPSPGSGGAADTLEALQLHCVESGVAGVGRASRLAAPTHSSNTLPVRRAPSFQRASAAGPLDNTAPRRRAAWVGRPT